MKLTGCLLRFAFACMLLFPVTSMHAAPRAPQDTQRTCETFRTSGGHYPPFVYRMNGEVQGAAIDLVRQAFKRVGVGVETQYLGPFNRVLWHARTGQIDGLPGVYRTARREKSFRYVAKIGPDPVAVFMRRDNDMQISELKDLKPYTGATRLGDSFGERLDQFAEKNLALHREGSITDAMLLLKHGRVDYVIFSYHAGRHEIRSLDIEEEIRTARLPMQADVPLWLVMERGSPCVVYADAVATELRDLRRSGAYAAAVEKHRQQLKQ